MQTKIGVEAGCWDNFSLDCYRNCPTYYNLRINYGVIKPAVRKTAADFGTAIHAALEHYYKEGMTDQSIKEALTLFSTTFHEDPADDKRTLMKGLEILSNYFIRYRIEPFTVRDIEIGGAVELGAYLYLVRIDLTVNWQSPQGIYGMDTKTTSSLYRIVSKPNNQITGYEYYLREMYQNVLGYMINAIGVYKATEEMDKSVPKVTSPKTGKLIYATKQREIFLRYPTSRTIVELELWKEETLHLIHQIEESTQRKCWPKYTHFCTAFASKCQYLDLCQAQDSKAILFALKEAGVYEDAPWVPYKEVAVEEEGGE